MNRLKLQVLLVRRTHYVMRPTKIVSRIIIIFLRFYVLIKSNNLSRQIEEVCAISVIYIWNLFINLYLAVVNRWVENKI